MAKRITSEVGITELDDLAKSLEVLPDTIRSYIMNNFGANGRYAKYLLECNQTNALEGLRPDGVTPISKTPVFPQTSTRYERRTRYEKEKQGKSEENVTLEDTGDFWRAETIKAGADTIYFIDNDAKASELEAVWGNVLGVTQEQWDVFIEMVRYDLAVKLKQIL